MDHVGVGETGCDIADLAVQFEQDVAHFVVGERIVIAVQLGCALGHRLLGVEDRWQHLVFHCDLATTLFGGADRIGDHGHHPLAHEPHDVVEHVGVVGIHQMVGVDRGAVALTRDVLPRVHAMHAWNLERGGLVDGDDARVGVRRMQHLEVQHPRHLGVHGEFDSSGDDPGGRGRDDAGADGLPGCRVLDAATPLIASSMARYPVQRQRFPFNARGRSCFCSSVKVADVMIIPAVQNPHWNPGASRNRCCIGCRFSGVPSPSMVVTSRPSARKAGVMQLCTGSPSSHTVQAPQSPASQPFLTPWHPSVRTKVRRHWPGLGCSSKDWPLTVYVMTDHPK